MERNAVGESWSRRKKGKGQRKEWRTKKRLERNVKKGMLGRG